MSQPVDLNNRDQLIQNAITSLSSKVVSHHSDLLAPMAVDAVLKIIDKETADNVDLRDIHVSKKLGGTVILKNDSGIFITIMPQFFC